MPRAGLDAAAVTRAAAAIADEEGLANLGMTAVAERLGVRAPSLYKHVGSLDDLVHRVAVLASSELGDVLRDAIQGRAGFEALRDAAEAMRAFIREHPGRYAAIGIVRAEGPDDPLLAAQGRVLASFDAILRGYALTPDEGVHALRMLRSMVHGFASLESTGGFQLATDTDESFAWMVALLDRELSNGAAPSPSSDLRAPARPVPASPHRAQR